MRVLAALAAFLAIGFVPDARAETVRAIAVAKPSPNNERRVALVIGNSAYKSSPLRNPVNDARAIARALSETGFAVTLVEDGTQAGMRRAIRTFGDDLLRGGVGLFYYAGHGMQVRGKNYLIPVNADIQREDEVEDQAVDANLMLSKMDTAKNALNIMILDACRNNPFQRSFRSSAQGLAQMDAPSGTLIAFATAPGSVAADGEGENGTYTKHLLEQIRRPGTPVEQLFKQVRNGVMSDTKERQVPWESSSLRGDFFFLVLPPGMQAEEQRRQQQQAIDKAVGEAVKGTEERAARERAEMQAQMQKLVAEMLAKQRAELEAELKARGASPPPVAAAPPPPAPKPAAPDPQLVEVTFWESVKGSANPADFAAYLERYPQGSFAPIARNRLAQLALKPASPGATPPVAAAPAPAVQAPAAAPPVQVASIAAAPSVPPSKPGMPSAGDRWVYRGWDVNRPAEKLDVTVEVKAVLDGAILETTRRGTAAPADWAYSPGVYLLGAQGIAAFSPYLTAFQALRAGDEWSDIPFQRFGACSTNPALTCRASGKVVRRERVTTPAGTFDAWRIEVAVVSRSMQGATGSREMVYWFDEGVKRIVKATARSFNVPQPDLDAELVSYQLN